jgi:hypothetical protein
MPITGRWDDADRESIGEGTGHEPHAHPRGDSADGNGRALGLCPSEAAGNRYLSKIISETRLLVRVFTSTFWRCDREKLDEANHVHRRLLEALRCKDVEAARIATVEAMQVSRDNALRGWNFRLGFFGDKVW